jgi:EAL domain-containing protein (putative c-di-GMP-specific phosphodiesterase class I)
VTHITFANKSRSKPHLEFYSDGASEARRVTIEKSPFRIGRSETSDLRIDSAQVSRDHAEIMDRGGVWFVRDLGSTNGTQVNGKQVSETLLADGDILRVAETELTFIASPVTQFQRMVTQKIPKRERAAASLSIPAEIAAARAMTEATLWQAIAIEFSAAVSLKHGAVEAVFAGIHGNNAAADPWPQVRMGHRAASRYRELYRLRTVELAKERAIAERLFVAVDASELETHQHLLLELEHVRELLPAEWELGVTVPLTAILENSRAGEFYHAVRDRGLLVAYDEFQGSGGQVMQIDAHVPDYVLVSDTMTKGLLDTRQPMRRLESVFAACDELVIKPVLPRCSCPQTLALCRDAGYDLILQAATHPSMATLAEPVGAV